MWIPLAATIGIKMAGETANIIKRDYSAPVYDDEIEFSRVIIPTPRRVSPKKAWKMRGKRRRK